MNKTRIFVIFLVVLFMTSTSCRKTLDPIDNDGKVSFLIRLPSIAIARFEARCISEDIFLDQVRIQSPSSAFFVEEFNHQRIPKNEIFVVGNHESVDGLWLITFIGTSAITDRDFQQIVPYEMVIAADDDNNN
ncbi:MAG: hypothetical protein PF484_07740 [Bacteroidales bacterium]|jgi:hypothetical protein|nr:hypothetical protein [Bacteroidales bacterium]